MAELTPAIIKQHEREYQQFQNIALRDRNLAEDACRFDRDFNAAQAAAKERNLRANDLPYGRYMAEKDQEDRVRNQERAKADAAHAMWRNGGFPPGFSFNNCPAGLICDPAHDAARAAEKKALALLKEKANLEYLAAREKSYQSEMPGLIEAYSAALIRSKGKTNQLDQVGTNAINRINQFSYGYQTSVDKANFLAPVRAEEEKVKNAIAAQNQSEKVSSYNAAQAAINNRIAAFGLKPNSTAALVKADVTAAITSRPSTPAAYVPNWKRKQEEAYAADRAAGRVLSDIVDKQKTLEPKATKQLPKNKKNSKVKKGKVAKLKKQR